MDNSEMIGVVTVTYNSAGVIDEFMESLQKQTYGNFILYAVDNASSDDTLTRLAKYEDPRIVAIANQKNVGVAEGNNVGIRAALRDGCSLVLLINNDTVFGSGLFQELLEGLQEYTCEMVVPKILFFDEPDRIWCAGGYFSVLRGASRHFGSGKKADDMRFNQARSVSYSPTCCMLIKSQVFDRVGLMDANYFIYHDDTDFCLRAYKAGVKLFYLPSVRLLHKVSSLTSGYSNFVVRCATRNHVYLVLKHYSRLQVVYYCFAYYLYNFWKYLFRMRSPKSFWVSQAAFWEGIALFLSSIERSKKKA